MWKRQPDGAFKVVMDLGVTTPGPAPFADGFTRAPHTDVYTGNASTLAATKSLRDTDAALTNAARAGQADAYRGHVAEGARLHRPDVLPLVGQDAIVAWLMGQPAYASGECKFAETARSGDLGYTGAATVSGASLSTSSSPNNRIKGPFGPATACSDQPSYNYVFSK